MDEELMEKIGFGLLAFSLMLVLSLQCGCATEYQRQNYALLADMTKQTAKDHPSEYTQATANLAESVVKLEGAPIVRLAATVEQAEMRTTSNNEYSSQGIWGGLVGLIGIIALLERVIKLFSGQSVFGLELLLGYFGINKSVAQEIREKKEREKTIV